MLANREEQRVRGEGLPFGMDDAVGMTTDGHAALERRLRHVAEVWPGENALFVVGAGGKILAGSKAGSAGLNVLHLGMIRAALAGRPVQGVARLEGLDRSASLPGDNGRAPPAFVVAEPIQVGAQVLGAVVAAFALTRGWIEGAEKRHGLDLSVRVGNTLLDTLQSAGAAGPSPSPGPPELRHFGGRDLAVATFAPARLAGEEKVLVAASLDLTELTRDHRRFLLYRLAAVALVGLCALAIAFYVARRMHLSVEGLERVLPGIASGKYEPVEVIATGDELETLARTWNGLTVQLREADLWKRALGKYLSRAALESVKRGDLQLGGTTLQATVLFSDIRGFTSMAERMPPEQLLKILNRYFTEMVSAVMQNEGIVDKFIGDCIMAVWGPPTPSKNDAQLAIKAVLEMRRRLDKLNLEFAAQGLPTLKTGIGLHSGPVVAGNIGADGDDSMAGKMEYTVIGDTVNLASRLESMTKEMKVDVLISEDTVRLAGAQAQVEALSEVKVRGRERAVQVYRLL